MNRSNEIGGRKFVFLFAILCAALIARPALGADDAKWYRGQLHTHSYLSDGHAFPEQAVEAYKERGYNFIALTDHNRFADNRNEWRDVMADEGGWPPKVCRAMYDAYVKDFGTDWVDSKTSGTVTSVRLKTYSEIKGKFEKPGQFIMLPGVEATQKLPDNHVHVNYVNLPLVLPCIKQSDLVKAVDAKQTISGLIALNAAEARKAAKELKRPYLFTLNHPFWVYYDVLAQNLIDCPQVRFFEICNGGSAYASPPKAESYTSDKFWDAVNAFRRIRGQQLIFGIGSDDAHFYDRKRINEPGGVGDAWVMVRASDLTPELLIAAMQRGDFYASTGVQLDDVAFTAADKTLRVKVKAAPGVKYTIHFITTKRGFDQSVTTVTHPADKGSQRPARTVPVYSEDIGRTVKTVAGVEGEYRLEDDDLYVRARVESDVPGKFSRNFHPKQQVAWTQPYAGE